MVAPVLPKITLVGAGPGDPDLITLGGIKALHSAGVVLYDALVNPQLLDHAPSAAPRIYVGKRANRHRYAQADINAMMVDLALRHGHVVRLKGGDPFVFGRGHEELEYARSRGMDVRVIPGISSAIALPELQGVPVTRRGVSESFWVLTGTTRNGCLSDDVRLAARSTATVIILMGMRKLAEICDCFDAAGKGKTPVMLIQHGSLPEERRLLGTVDDIAEKAEQAGIGSPGLIVIGEVAALHPKWNDLAVGLAVESMHPLAS